MKNLFLFDSREDENVVIKHIISYKRKKIKLDNYYSFFEILSFKQKKSNIHAKMVYLISLGEKSPKKDNDVSKLQFYYWSIFQF